MYKSLDNLAPGYMSQMYKSQNKLAPGYMSQMFLKSKGIRSSSENKLYVPVFTKTACDLLALSSGIPYLNPFALQNPSIVLRHILKHHLHSTQESCE